MERPMEHLSPLERLSGALPSPIGPLVLPRPMRPQPGAMKSIVYCEFIVLVLTCSLDNQDNKILLVIITITVHTSVGRDMMNDYLRI